MLADDSERAGQPKSLSFGFSGEEGLENLGLNLGRNTGFGVADRYLYNLRISCRIDSFLTESIWFPFAT